MASNYLKIFKDYKRIIGRANTICGSILKSYGYRCKAWRYDSKDSKELQGCVHVWSEEMQELLDNIDYEVRANVGQSGRVYIAKIVRDFAEIDLWCDTEYHISPDKEISVRGLFAAYGQLQRNISSRYDFTAYCDYMMWCDYAIDFAETYRRFKSIIITACTDCGLDYHKIEREINRPQAKAEPESSAPQQLHFNYTFVENQVQSLYNLLSDGGYIEVDFNSFEYLVSGNNTSSPNRIKWKKTGRLLGYFIDCLFGDTDRLKLWEITRQCFTIKGEEIKINSIRTSVSKWKNDNLERPQGYIKIDEILKESLQ